MKALADEPSTPAMSGRELSRRLADILYAVLLWALVLLSGWHLARHEVYWDWSGSGRNGLSAESLTVVGGLEGPVRIRVFIAPDHPAVRDIEQLLMRYRRASDQVSAEYIDPVRSPELARRFDVQRLGQLVVDYQGRRESLTRLSEAALTNAIARLTLTRKPWIALLEGHGERSFSGGSGADLGRFAQWLEQRGFRLQTVDLARVSQIPSNTDLLVLSVPAIQLFPGEVDAVLAYIERGGNLLWLLDPGDWNGYQPLAERLGLRRLPGELVDAAGRALNVASPNVAVVTQWPSHSLWRDLATPAIFPGAVTFASEVSPPWRLETELLSSDQSWNETGPIRGKIARDPALDEQAGPLAFALVLTRALPNTLRTSGSAPWHGGLGEQRLVVIGDGDFLSNAALEQGANRALGLRLVRWLTNLDLAIEPRGAAAERFDGLSASRALVISLFALVILPLGLLMLALLASWRRRHG